MCFPKTYLYGGLLNQPKSLSCRNDSVPIGSQFDDTLRNCRHWYITSLFDLQDMRLRGSLAIKQVSNTIWLKTTHSTCGLKQLCLFCLWTLHLYCYTNIYPVCCLLLLEVSKVNWQQGGTHQGSRYKWQNCTWKQQLRALLRQCVKWIGETKFWGESIWWECESVSVYYNVCITGVWQLKNSDVQSGVTSESEMLSCHPSILWQYAISTRCHAWRDMTLWMSVLMHFKKGLSV